MFFRRGIVLTAALGALLFAMLVSGGASAHPGHAHSAHAHPVTAHAKAPLATRGPAPVAAFGAELKTHIPAPADHHAPLDCSDRGCCSNGHCAGCCNALAPAAFAVFGPPQSVRLGNPDSTRPTALVREGPPRPPKSLV